MYVKDKITAWRVVCAHCRRNGPAGENKPLANVVATALKWVELTPGNARMVCPDCQAAAVRANLQEAADLELDKMP